MCVCACVYLPYHSTRAGDKRRLFLKQIQQVCVHSFSSPSWVATPRFGLVLWHINHCRLFNAKSILIHMKSSISNNSSKDEHSFLFTHR